MEIKQEILEKELNNGKVRSIYLFYGNEKYLIDTMIKKIKKNFGELVQGINYVIIDETNINDFIFNIEVPSFGYDNKLILVKNSKLFKKDGRKKELTPLQKEVKQYMEENISMIHDTTVIVFQEEEVDKNELFEVVNQNGAICNIMELKPIELVQKLKKVCNLYQVDCENSTLNYFIETVGTNLQVLMNEIRKLIEYAGKGGKVTQDSIDNLAIKQMESVIFELTDNLGNKKMDKALEVLDNLIYQKEPLQKILVTLYHHFKKLYLCAIAIRLKQEIATLLNLKPNQTFLMNKYKRQVSYFTENELREILKQLVEIDYQSKNGLMDIDIALRSVLCNYCS